MTHAANDLSAEHAGHPMRRAVIHTFRRCDMSDGGAKYIARLHPYDTYPVFWHGDTAEAAHTAAADFVADAIEKNEAAVLARQEAAAKAREAAARKKEAKAEAGQ